MSIKKNLVIIVLLGVALTVYHLSRKQVNHIRSDYTYRLQVSAMPIPPEIMLALAGEFKGIMSDYLLLEAASFIGGNVEATPEQWKSVAYLLEQSSVLDPYFKQIYILTQGVLPWRGKKYKETLNILERSKKHRQWDWEPGFFKGFNYYYFFNDNLSASKELMAASKRSNAPIMLATWASKLSSIAGQTQSAITFLKNILSNTEDEGIRKSLQQRIIALEGVVILEQAIDRFTLSYGRVPVTLKELTDYSVLTFIPENPYGRPYSYNYGKVQF